MNFPLKIRQAVMPHIVLATMGVTDAGHTCGQSILNGGFGSGTTNWTSCNVEIAASIAYGGGSLFNKVASVNAGLIAGNAADDNLLCQTITGFTVGSIYMLSFNATRCQLLGTPATVSSFVTLGNSVETVVSRSGGWNMSPAQAFFMATQTSYDLSITPGQTGILGMLFDDITITLWSGLPVELLYFNATADGNDVQLSWATATEDGNDHFTVERSADGGSFAMVTELPGAGDSQNVLQYAAVDEAPMNGTSYYRLKQTDMAGGATYSDVVGVEHHGDRPVVICAADHFEVRGNAAGHTLNVLSANGELVHSAMVRGSWVERPALAQGLYVLALTDPISGTKVVSRMVQE